MAGPLRCRDPQGWPSASCVAYAFTAVATRFLRPSAYGLQSIAYPCPPKPPITPTREENYPEWYQQVVKAADLAENSDVRGCMVIKPWGYAIWENIQRRLDAMFKATGHVNAYFPLFIPMSFLEKEAAARRGLRQGVRRRHAPPPGARRARGLQPARAPSSKSRSSCAPRARRSSAPCSPAGCSRTATCRSSSTSGPTSCAGSCARGCSCAPPSSSGRKGTPPTPPQEEAQDETRQMLDVYADFAEDYMAMPVIKGEKTAGERFPGAVNTYSIEAMMQDRKALQAGTSHFLGQNFSQGPGDQVPERSGRAEYAWTTCWGVSTRLIGGLIMTHSDDDGLVLPPRLAPAHVVILPIYRNDEENGHGAWLLRGARSRAGRASRTTASRSACGSTTATCAAATRSGSRSKRACRSARDRPARHRRRHAHALAPRLVEKARPGPARRPRPGHRQAAHRDPEVAVRPRRRRPQSGNRAIDSLDEFEEFFTPKNAENPEIHGGLAYCHFVDSPEMDEKLKALKVTVRCVPRRRATTSRASASSPASRARARRVCEGILRRHQ